MADDDSRPEHNQPNGARASPSNPPIVPRQQPVLHLSLETALANANNDTLAALEAVLAERNVMSGQNIQLWKLVEKQRTGYASVLKELDRVRIERDRAVAKAERTHTPGHKASGSAGVSTSSTIADLPSERTRERTREGRSRERSTSRSRAPILRQQSDETPTRDPHAHTLASSRSYEPLRPNNDVLSSSSTINSLSSSTSQQSTTPATPSRPQPARGDSAPNLTPTTQPLHILGKKHSQPDTSQPPVGDAPRAIPAPAQPLPPPSTRSASLTVASASDDLQRRVGRESRITLPDEASRYIVNMQDSPVASPGVKTEFSTPTAPPQRTPARRVPVDDRSEESSNEGPRLVPTKVAAQAEPSPFLDMLDEEDDEDDESNGVEPPPASRSDAEIESSVSSTHAAPTRALPPKPPVPGRPTIITTPSETSHQSFSSLSPDSTSMRGPANGTAAEAPPLPEDHATHTQPAKLQRRRDASPAPTYHSNVSFPHHNNSTPQVPAYSTERPVTPQISAAEFANTVVRISNSNIKANERGKEVLSFTIQVTVYGKEPWKVEKLYSDVLAVDTRLRPKLNRSQAKKLAPLPEAKLFKDHAPAKVDQRKAILETYLQSLVKLPVTDNAELRAFFATDIVTEAMAPVASSGYKEGYLTKRGKNFGGWKTRYFILQSSVLEYYESRGGAHLGSIVITGAQIGRQQKTSRDVDDENAYRHAFLIIEAKRGPSGTNTRHVLCAESDKDRDSWVDVLVRHVAGNYDDTLAPPEAQGFSRPSTSSASTPTSDAIPFRRPRAMSKDEISRGAAVPISQLPPDAQHPKLFAAAPLPPTNYDSSPSSPSEMRPPLGVSPPTDAQLAQKILNRGHGHSPADVPLSSSLPSGLDSKLSHGHQHSSSNATPRSNSELGHYSDMKGGSHGSSDPYSPMVSNRRDDRAMQRASFHPRSGAAPPPERPATPPEGFTPKKISGPLNGKAIPPGKGFGSKDPVPVVHESPNNERAMKAKSGRFWPSFGRSPADKAPPQPNAQVNVPPVFGVTINESLAVAQIANLPAIVFRCIEYLEAKKSDQEEGIYRLSGSSAVIKGLKDRFNAEGDVDLLKSDEFWDPHAIAGLLKGFLRELPVSILTRELHPRFLAVIDLMDPADRIAELSGLVSQLPLANYSLLRALTSHLILIVQNSNVNKMTLRNVGIVFSPTLQIPAGVFSLMLSEFKRVFNVTPDEGAEASEVEAPEPAAPSLVINKRSSTERPSKRNSRVYESGAADHMLGLAGRTLQETDESDDGETLSLQEEEDEVSDAETETENELEQGQAAVSETTSSPPTTPGPTGGFQERVDPPPPPQTEEQRSGHSSRVAAGRGLQITVGGPAKSGLVPGLPLSPRPGHRPPGQPSTPSSSSPSAPPTPRERI